MTDKPLTKLEQQQKEFDELWRSAEFPAHGRPDDCADRRVVDAKADAAAEVVAPRLLGLFPRHISETDPSSCAQVGVALTKSNFIPPSGGKGADGDGELARLQELDVRCALHVIARGYTVFRASTPTTQLSMDKYNYRTEDLKFKTGGAVAPSMGLRNVGLAIPTDIYRSSRSPFEPQWTQHGVAPRTPAIPDALDDEGVGQEIADTFRAFGINHGCPYFHIYSTAGGKFGLIPHGLLYDLITRQLQARIKSPRDLPVSNVVQRDGTWFPFIPMRELMKRRVRRAAYNEKRRSAKDSTKARGSGPCSRDSLGEKQGATAQNIEKDAPAPAKTPLPSTPRNNNNNNTKKMGRMPGKVISSPVDKWVYTEELGPRSVYRIGQLTPTQGEAGDYMFLGGSAVEKQNFAAGPLRDNIKPGEEEYYAIRLYKRHIDQVSELVTWSEAYPGSYAKCLNSIEEARDYLARVPSVPPPKKRPAPKKKTSTKKRSTAKEASGQTKAASSKKSAPAPKETKKAAVKPRYKVGDVLNVGDPALELDPMEVVAMEPLLFRGTKRLAAVVQVNDEDGLTEYAVLDPSDADYNDENTGGAVITLQRHPDAGKFTLDHQEYVAMWPEEENLPVCQGRSATPKRTRKKAQTPLDVYKALGQATKERRAANGGVDEGEEATSNASGASKSSKRSSSGGGSGGGGGGSRTRNPPPERKAADVQKYIVSTTGMTLTAAKKLNTAINTLFEQVGATLNKQPATNVDPLTALAMGNHDYADFDYLCDAEASPSEMMKRLSNIQQLRDVMCNMFPVLSRPAGNYFKTAVEAVVGTDQWTSLKPADIAQALADHPDFRIAASSIIAQGGDLFYKKFGSVSNDEEDAAAESVGKKRARPSASQSDKKAPAKKKQKVVDEEEEAVAESTAVEEPTNAEAMQFDDEEDEEALAALHEYEAEREQVAQDATPMLDEEDDGQEGEEEEEAEEEEEDVPDSQRSDYSLENEANGGDDEGEEEEDDVIESS